MVDYILRQEYAVTDLCFTVERSTHRVSIENTRRSNTTMTLYHTKGVDKLLPRYIQEERQNFAYRSSVITIVVTGVIDTSVFIFTDIVKTWYPFLKYRCFR